MYANEIGSNFRYRHNAILKVKTLAKRRSAKEKKKKNRSIAIPKKSQKIQRKAVRKKKEGQRNYKTDRKQLKWQ